MSAIFIKDPDAVLDFTINWDDGYLVSEDSPGETVTSSTWSVVPAGELVIDSDTFTVTTATAFISGGMLGRLYRLTNTIETSGDRTDDRSIILRVEHR